MDRLENTSSGRTDSSSSGQPAPAPSQEVKPAREGSDEALERSSPTDNRSDEKVIVNSPRTYKTGKEPLQTVADKTEVHGNDEEILEKL